MNIFRSLVFNYSTLLFISTLFFCSDVQAGKKQCKSYLEKLHNIQSQQRAGYNLKQGNKLEAHAEKARKKWWQCEQGLTVSKNKTKKKKYSNKAKVKKETHYLTNQSSAKTSPFVTNKPIVMKSKYQGKQQQAWLIFYQQPKECLRPKTIKKFARCIENKRQQAEAFEQEYPN